MDQSGAVNLVGWRHENMYIYRRPLGRQSLHLLKEVSCVPMRTRTEVTTRQKKPVHTDVLRHNALY